MLSSVPSSYLPTVPATILPSFSRPSSSASSSFGTPAPVTTLTAAEMVAATASTVPKVSSSRGSSSKAHADQTAYKMREEKHNESRRKRRNTIRAQFRELKSQLASLSLELGRDTCPPPENLNTQEQLLDMAKAALYTCDDEIKRLETLRSSGPKNPATPSSTKASKTSKTSAVAVGKRSKAKKSSSSLVPSSSSSSSQHGEQRLILDTLSRVHRQLFLDSDIERSVFDRSLRMLDVNYAYLLNPRIFKVAADRQAFLAQRPSIKDELDSQPEALRGIRELCDEAARWGVHQVSILTVSDLQIAQSRFFADPMLASPFAPTTSLFDSLLLHGSNTGAGRYGPVQGRLLTGIISAAYDDAPDATGNRRVQCYHMATAEASPNLVIAHPEILAALHGDDGYQQRFYRFAKYGQVTIFPRVGRPSIFDMLSYTTTPEIAMIRTLPSTHITTISS